MKYLSVLMGILLIFSFQNCANNGSSTSDTGSASAQQITYQYIESKILTPKCLQCHHNGLEFGGLNVATYQRVMQVVVPGDPYSSPLYTRSFNTTTFTLTQQESDAIKIWILNGAKNNY